MNTASRHSKYPGLTMGRKFLPIILLLENYNADNHLPLCFCNWPFVQCGQSFPVYESGHGFKSKVFNDNPNDYYGWLAGFQGTG